MRAEIELPPWKAEIDGHQYHFRVVAFRYETGLITVEVQGTPEFRIGTEADVRVEDS